MADLLSTLLLLDDAADVLERGVVTIDVLGNDQGEQPQIIGYSAASGATLTMDANNNLVYTADAKSLLALAPGQKAQDTITYRVQDVHGEVAEAKVIVTVTGAPNAPDIYGGLRSNVLAGTVGDERIFAGFSGDIVFADAGADTVYGGLAKDHLYGGDGDDLMFGGLGADWLYGDYGDDTMSGGLGRDVFAFEDFWGDDVINDFNPVIDKIQLPKVYYENFKALMKDVAYDGHGDLVITTNGNDGLLHTITLLDVSAKSLHSSNFIFV